MWWLSEAQTGQKLIARTGDEHERAVLEEFKLSVAGLVQISRGDTAAAH
jgi:hypothetical protein